MDQLCKCGRAPATSEYHQCPYECEILDNHDENYCDCCEECERNCAEDV